MKILITDDERSIRFSLKTNFSKLGFEVFDAETGEEALEIFKLHNHQVVILDVKLPGIDGIEVLKKIKKISPDCIVIMITYLSEVRLAVKAMKLGAFDYFSKPFSLKEVNNSVIGAYKYLETKRKLEKMPQDSKLIGKNKSIKKIKETTRRFSSLDIETCVLIEGESGTGKEVVARLIYENKGVDLPFVILNCAAIPQNLQESELFGYEKGAFTGAIERKAGLIEEANGGILFLDEVGDMDLGLQAKLLRVLQERKYRAVGSLKEIHFNTTIITATNKNLKAEIELGNFRSDLYYRLNIVPIYIPPLRERKEDIPLLIDFFLVEYNLKLNKNISGFDYEAMNMMINYDWPGNVRELKNIIERISIFQETEVIKIDDLPKDLQEDHTNIVESFNPLETSEQQTIFNSLLKNDWNITKTSQELGISRSTLRRKIEKYELINHE